MTEQEKREKVITNVTAIVSDMQEEVDEWKDYSDSELSHGLTCDCDWWYAALQTLKDALALLKAQEPVSAALIVRCKDCMYFRPWRHDRGDDSRCEFWNTEMGAEDYCSQAIYLNNGREGE